MRIAALSAFCRRRGWHLVPAVVAAVLFFGMAGQSIRAADKSDEKSVVSLKSDPTLLLRKAGPEKPWEVVKGKGTEFHAGDTVLGGFGTPLNSANGAVQLRLMGDVNGDSPFPIVETAVVLGDPKDVDLAFVMDRGQVDLINKKETRAAKIKITVLDRTAIVTLAEPGARMALEIYGRWPRGVKFIKHPKGPHSPALAVVAVAIKGEVEIKGQTRTVSLKAPPGPALFRLDDLHDKDIDVQTIKELPSWIDAIENNRAKTVRVTAGKFRDAALKTSLADALDKFVLSEDPVERRLAIFLMAGTDDIFRLAMAMSTTKHLDTWDAGVIALRNWIGRGPGQDEKLYNALIAKGKFSEGEAATVMDLLHSYGPEALMKPETFEALIDYLECDRLAIRGLAYWHLSRLVPQGKKIGYNPLATKDERAKAIKEWHEFIPAGTLPGQPKEKPKAK